MLESDIMKNDAAEHHVEHHGASEPDVHSGGIAPHDPGSAHGTHEHGHHEQSDTTDSNGGNNQ